MKLPKPFKQKLKDKDLLTIPQAALVAGYSPQHLRKLCAAEKVEHERRGPWYYFTPRQIEKLFSHIDAKS
jgi:hypothetical protein